jgi:hypothetical protein
MQVGPTVSGARPSECLAHGKKTNRTFADAKAAACEFARGR